jgi:hypothetical protein
MNSFLNQTPCKKIQNIPEPPSMNFHNKTGLLLLVDFEKAFDSVE